MSEHKCYLHVAVLLLIISLTEPAPAEDRALLDTWSTDQRQVVMSNIKRRIIEQLLVSQKLEEEWQPEDQHQISSLMAAIGSVSDQQLIEAAAAASEANSLKEESSAAAIRVTVAATTAATTISPPTDSSSTLSAFEKYAIKHGNPFYTSKPKPDTITDYSQQKLEQEVDEATKIPDLQSLSDSEQLLQQVLQQLTGIKSPADEHQGDNSAVVGAASTETDDDKFRQGLQIFSQLYGSDITSQSSAIDTEAVLQTATEVNSSPAANSVDVQRLSRAVSQLVSSEVPAMLGGLTTALEYFREGRLLAALQTAVPALTRTTPPLMHALSALEPVLSPARSSFGFDRKAEQRRRRIGLASGEKTAVSEPFNDPYQVGRLFGSALKLVTYVSNYGTYVVLA